MKAVVLFLSVACLAQAMNTPTYTADKTFLIKQKSIYELLWHVDQPTIYHPELYQKARSYSIEDNVNSYTDQTAVTEFLQRWKHGMLPRGEIFIPTKSLHIKEAISLFRILYTAKDFETFYNTAVWARFYVNEQMYQYVMFVVVMHRPDTRYVRLPPLYEVVPEFFFNDEVLHQAYQIAMGNTVTTKKTVGGIDHYYIPTNYSDSLVINDQMQENKLNYFTEDIGLNAFYFWMLHEYPLWMNSVKYNMPTTIRGQLYLYEQKRLLDRYNLEKLANDMGETSHVITNRPMNFGYHPSMHYHNGVPFPQRPIGSMVPTHMYKEVQELHNYHVRIANAIDKGFITDKDGKHIKIYTEEGINYLGNVIQGNADSVNLVYYGYLEMMYKKVLGTGMLPTAMHNTVPTSLDIYCTNMRDPLFYEILNNILVHYMKYKENLSYYKQEELVFPGVKIESVTVDKLMTFFDQFETLLNNIVSVRSHKEAQSMLIKARQYRLNHKPFTYHITVNSEKNVKAMVRVFLGPKMDIHGHELDMSENYKNFLEMDKWIVDLKPGINKIERNSHESIYVVPDETPSEILYKKILKAIEGSETFTYPSQLYGLPDRLTLPKGKKEGMPFKLFVSVSHYDTNKAFELDSPIWGPDMWDGRSLGYPLDRPVQTYNFNVPNFHMKDVLIYHKQAEEMNLTV